ncbi:MAG: serine dehydratase [Proteobacteria bacterium]|nr:serine dehydratase [Pseudomonadota bacterium]
MLHFKTPLFEDTLVYKGVSRRIYFKMDCYQPSGSFKIRGIGLLCSHHAALGASGLCSSSGGNAGLAVAYSGQKLGLKTTIVVPSTTTEAVRQRIRKLGAWVLEHGDVWDEADVFARSYAKHHNLAYIHPFDDPIIWSGHASMIEEMKNQGDKPDVVVCSVGGGGLMCGVVEGLQKHGWSDVEVIAVETHGAASLSASVEADELVTIDSITSIAKTLGARRVAQRAFELTKEHPIHCLQVSDAQAVRGCVDLLDLYRVLVEPSCGAAFAALKTDHPSLLQAKTIAVVVCGGSGVDTKEFLHWHHTFGPLISN